MYKSPEGGVKVAVFVVHVPEEVWLDEFTVCTVVHGPLADVAYCTSIVPQGFAVGPPGAPEA